MGYPGQMQDVETLQPEQYRLRSIELVGLYAVRPTWEDGHDTGIFAFERLRAMHDDAADDLARKAAGEPLGQRNPLRGDPPAGGRDRQGDRSPGHDAAGGPAGSSGMMER